MAGGIDTSKRKPRKAYGTPAYKIRHRFAIIGLAVGVCFGALYVATIPPKLTALVQKYLYQRSERELEKQFQMSLTSKPTTEILKEIMEEKADPQ